MSIVSLWVWVLGLHGVLSAPRILMGVASLLAGLQREGKWLVSKSSEKNADSIHRIMGESVPRSPELRIPTRSPACRLAQYVRVCNVRAGSRHCRRYFSESGCTLGCVLLEVAESISYLISRAIFR